MFSRKILIAGGVVLFIAGGIFLQSISGLDTSKLTTTTVQQDDVLQLVSISGYLEADNTADLGFPLSGRIGSILVTEGDIVQKGSVLATLGNSTYASERRKIEAQIAKADATRNELLNGQTFEERAVTEATVLQAKAAWELTTATELQKVQNALTALRSDNLIARSTDPEEKAGAPTVTGSYICEEEGTYTLEVYASGSDSNYSVRYAGLESGTVIASFVQPVALGSCGLSLQFKAGELYSNSNWKINVPNTDSITYLSRLRAYELAQLQATQNIQAAKETYELAENVATKDFAAPRVEAMIQANATVAAAQSDLAILDASLEDKAIYAPFDGIITNVKATVGEVATNQPIITILADSSFTLIARVPEIDITKLQLGQEVRATFDARLGETQVGAISYISPIATEIDGVSYFETKIILQTNHDWLRSGLNADIDIIIEKALAVLTLPSRFIASSSVSVLEDNKIINKPVTIGLVGNNGLTEVTNLTAGITVVAP